MIEMMNFQKKKKKLLIEFRKNFIDIKIDEIFRAIIKKKDCYH